MTNKQRMKRLVSLRHALVLSICSMILCVSMLAGSTFAWFSDSASTAPETITAGNLQVELLKYVSGGGDSEGEYVAVDGSDASLIPDSWRWEPGKVLTLSLAVHNRGSVSAACNVILNVQNGGLADVMEYIVLDNVNYETANGKDWDSLKSLASVGEEEELLATALNTKATGNDVNPLSGVQSVTLLGAKPDPIILSPNKADSELKETRGDLHCFVLAIRMKPQSVFDLVDGEPKTDLMGYMLMNVQLNLQVNAVQTTGDSDGFGGNYDEEVPGQLPEPHTYYLCGYSVTDKKTGSKPMQNATMWNGLVQYIIENSSSGVSADYKTNVRKVVFGRFNEQESNLGSKKWEDGVDVGLNITDGGIKVEEKAFVKGFYNNGELYILVNEPLGFIAVNGTMQGEKTTDGYFSDWTELEEVDLTCLNTSELGKTGVNGEGTPSSYSMASMFAGCTKLKSIKFGSGFVTSSVTDMRRMFYGCSSLESLDLSVFNTSNVKDMSAMFYGCSSEKFKELDISSFDTRNVTAITWSNKADEKNQISGLFEGCTNLETIKWSSSVFSLEGVNNFQEMFSGCRNLKSLDLKNIKIAPSENGNMKRMFFMCMKIETLDLSSFDTSDVKYMSEMFCGCAKLSSVDLSSFDVNNVEDMSSMFERCHALTTLDLSSFNTKNNPDITKMFTESENLETIYATQYTSNGGFRTTKGTDVFKGCSSINKNVEGAGVLGEDYAVYSQTVKIMKYDVNHLSAGFARVGYEFEEGYFSPGYFIEKPAS